MLLNPWEPLCDWLNDLFWLEIDCGYIVLRGGDEWDEWELPIGPFPIKFKFHKGRCPTLPPKEVDRE